MKSNAQIAKTWVDTNVVLSEHCEVEYSDLYDSLEALLLSCVNQPTSLADTSTTSKVELPPIRSDLHEMERLIKPSETVLIRIIGQKGLLMGRYLHGGEFWQADTIHGEITVEEWWPLPLANSGYRIKNERESKQ